MAVAITNSGNNRIDYGDLSAFDSRTAMSFAFTLTPSEAPAASQKYIFAQHNISGTKGWGIRAQSTDEIAAFWGVSNQWFGKITNTSPLVNGRKISVVVRFWNMDGSGGSRSVDIWVNGVLQTTAALYSSSVSGTDNADSVTIGCDDEGTNGCVAGSYAEVAAWSEKIPDAIAERISLGFSPTIYLTNGIFYAPLYSTSDLADRWGSATGTNYNATDATHPRVLGFAWPSPALLPKPASIRPDAGANQIKRSVISQSFTLAGTAPPSGGPYTYLWEKLAHYAIGTSTLVPVMTGATSPEGVASAQYQEVGQEAWHLFASSGNWGVAWRPYGGWLQYQFARPTRVDRYGLIPTATVSQAPSAWTFEGSYDGTTWTELGRITAQGGWVNGVEKQFPVQVDLAAPFLYYRVFVTANNGDYHCTLQRLKFYGREATGTGTPTFTDNTSLTSGVTFDQFGTYLLRLKATSGGVISYDNVEITLEEGVPARVTIAPVEAALTEAAGPALVTIAPIEVLMLDEANPLRMSQVLAELANKTPGAIRVSQAMLELLRLTTIETRFSQVVAELMTLTVIESRISQVLTELVNAKTTDIRMSHAVVEVLGKLGSYCGVPALSPAPLCGKADVLAWLEWTVPMRES